MDFRDLCSVKKEDFDEIFNDFFEVRIINQEELESKIDRTNIYTNYQIKKVEIKSGLNYNDFLEKLLKKFNSYFYDWNRDWVRSDLHKSKAYEWVNNYTPRTGILLEDFKKHTFGWKTWEDFIQGNKIVDITKNEKELIVEYLKTSQISDVLELQEWEKYVLLSKHNKISIQSQSKILWSLHWDIWEFILYFFVEWFLHSPILFSKIRHSKSSWADKIKWTDGIHFIIEDDQPKLLFLESKFKKDFFGCVDEVVSSQFEFLDNTWEWDINNELHILEWKWPLVDKDFWIFFEEGFEKFIDPYYTWELNQKELPFDLVSWLIYEHDTSHFIEEETLERVNALLKAYKDIESSLAWRKVTILLLPMLSSEEILKIFLDKTKT